MVKASGVILIQDGSNPSIVSREIKKDLINFVVISGYLLMVRIQSATLKTPVRFRLTAPMSKKLDLNRCHKESETLQRLINNGSLEEVDIPKLVELGLAQGTVDYYFAWKTIPKLIEKF
jgi:hypothetical protein